MRFSRRLARTNGHPGLSSVGVRVELAPGAPLDPNAPSVLRVRADCGGRLFTANSPSYCIQLSVADTFTSVHRFKGSIPQ